MKPGDIVGHYRILEPLGKGGMGEVFVAEDTRLHRRVALKVLPQILAGDPDSRQRFEREAQAVAALNHPNIVTIHSVEEHGGRLFLTMELVDGRPLGEAIERGGLPLDRLLRIGIEVADALAAAQQRGITHRDVKPANIVLTAGGRAKVLDFGLAKVHEAAAAANDDLTRLSGGSDITGEGKIVGTVAYMSPEQAEGKPVDPRSDIFSLGVVLHEMATGERPFKGDTNVSIISSIIKDTPAPITDSNPGLPADLARIVRRCLAKDPERRYQTAADLRNELEELKQDTASGTVTIARPVRRSRGRVAFAIGAAGLVLIALAGAWFVRGRRQVPPPAASFTIDRLGRLTTTGTAFLAAISPDGRYVVHVKGEPHGLGLWMRQTATTSDVRIVAPADVRFDGIAFSPDGNYAYYNCYDGVSGLATLYRVPVLGGTPARVVEDVDSPVTFSPDQSHIAFMRGAIVRGTTVLIVADVNGANPRELATAPAPDKFQSEGPSWSPDGKTILATASSTRPGVPTAIYAVDAASGAARQIGGPWGYARDVQWFPDGKSFLTTAVDLSGMSAPQIWQVAYPSGDRSRVTNDLNAYISASISADGRSLAAVQTETLANLYVMDPGSDAPRRVPAGANARASDGIAGIAWMPDNRLVYTSSTTGLSQLWICDADGGNARQLTSMRAPASFPSAAPDGRWIYFTSFGPEGTAIFRVAPDGSGLQQLTKDGDSRNAVVSPDGKTLYLSAQRTGSARLMRVSAEGGTPDPVSERSGSFHVGSISPDGTRLLGVAWNAELRRATAAMLELKDGTVTMLPDLPTAMLFLPDGSLAAVQRVQGKSAIVALRGSSSTGARTLAPPSEEFILNGAVSRDGRIAFSRGMPISDVVLIKAR